MKLSEHEIKLYKQEVHELTNLFHTKWTEMKEILASKIDVENAYLCFYVEGEDDDEYGVLLTNEAEIYEFEIVDGQLDSFDKQNNEEIKEEVPQVNIALEIQKTK